jgi:hypothetical protein
LTFGRGIFKSLLVLPNAAPKESVCSKMSLAA